MLAIEFHQYVIGQVGDRVQVHETMREIRELDPAGGIGERRVWLGSSEDEG